jgi:hypothetical protein
VSFATDGVPLPTFDGPDLRDYRRSERVTVQRPVTLKTSDGWSFDGICTDVNLSGIGLDTDHLLKVGQRVYLEMPAKSGANRQIPMIVIYRMRKHYGLSALASLDEVLELLPVQG